MKTYSVISLQIRATKHFLEILKTKMITVLI